MARQLKLNLYNGSWGGRRPRAGRKRIHSKGVAHRTRERINHRTPLHINFKFRTLIKNKVALKILKRAIINARSHGLRVIHFSMQSNHLHFIVEADSNEILTRGMRSLTITFAKGIEKGRIQIERYHLHVLKTLQETRNAIRYVLFNQQKHEKGTFSKIDEYSSLLNMNGAPKIIRKFAKDMKMTLIIKKTAPWEMDQAKSYFLKKEILL